ncbi:formate dehydrogenase accessory sulfurtransferase FdhD [Desulforamulus ruminis]|uniref:Sulfur carrier protein FdhD n=1 Tax=Desulforamulus ruminis (strain ATCC 23193 / DSM 2154 / NCIMB 8452 / DL) TaxID=696281 RepID=F6DUH1_DESRL|nr:formate dehydrogenase accessory sulfurtransferase FdhD [Desulforamulus ruminis]AEG59038.1 formate dehydrogenase family accessory protein FdhD [Desulforamulus ruminis DSM 2154]
MTWQINRTSINIVKIKGDKILHTEDPIVREVPVTLFLNGREFVTMVCSPEGLEELAVGFLCSEGLLQSPEDLNNIQIDYENGTVHIEALEGESEKKFLKRNITSCCGRGRPVFYFVNDAKSMNKITTPLLVTPGQVWNLSDRLEEMSVLFQQTGGVHNAALCAPTEVILFYEDVGRHNAVDKIFGRAFLNGISLEDKILVFSGRVSSEIVIKVGKMGLPVIISRSAPTDLGIEMAEKLGITIVGFAKGERMNVYTYPERILG